MRFGASCGHGDAALPVEAVVRVPVSCLTQNDCGRRENLRKNVKICEKKNWLKYDSTRF